MFGDDGFLGADYGVYGDGYDRGMVPNIGVPGGTIPPWQAAGSPGAAASPQVLQPPPSPNLPRNYGDYGANSQGYRDYTGSGGYKYRLHADGTIEILQGPAGGGVGKRLTAKSHPAAYQAIMAELSGKRVNPAQVATLIQQAAAAVQASIAPPPPRVSPTVLPKTFQPSAAAVPPAEPDSVPSWVWWLGGATALIGVGGAFYALRKKS